MAGMDGKFSDQAIWGQLYYKMATNSYISVFSSTCLSKICVSSKWEVMGSKCSHITLQKSWGLVAQNA